MSPRAAWAPPFEDPRLAAAPLELLALADRLQRRFDELLDAMDAPFANDDPSLA